MVRRWFSIRAAAVAAVLTLVSGLAAGVAGAAPSLLDGTGTQPPQDALFAMALGPEDPVGCAHLGVSSVPFGGRSIVRNGPFAGEWMTFTGSFTLGPQTQVIPGESYLRVLTAVDVGPVTSLQGSFTIGSGVTGTLTGVAPPSLYTGEQNVGSCYGVGPGDAFGYVGMAHGGITGIHSWATYTATVDGQTVDGTMLLSAFQPCNENGCGIGDNPFFFATQAAPDTTPPTLQPEVLVPLPGGGSTTYIAVGDPAVVEINANDGESGIVSSSCDPVDTRQGGSHTITCRATNGAGLTASVQVTYVVDGNEPPVAEAITASLDEDTTVAIEVYASDPDADPLTFTVTTGPTKGVLTGTSPVFTYRPAPDANGADSFTYEISDGVNVVTATVSITIRPINDAPFFDVGPDQVVLPGSGTTSVPGWATGITVGPPNESAQQPFFVIFSNTNPSLFSVAPAVSGSGALTYTVASGATGRADIIACVQDGGDPPGAVPSETCHDFSITVSAPAPDLPRS